MEVSGYYTTRGRTLSAKLLTGVALNITRVTAGDGDTDLSAAVLARDCQSLPMNKARRNGTTVTLPVTMAAALATEDYILRELGVYAEDPDEGEILYRIYRMEEPVHVVAGSRLTIRFNLEETVSETAQVSVIGTAAGLLTEGDLDTLRGMPQGLAALDETGTVPPEQMPYFYGIEDLTAGESALETGRLYFVYE